MTMLQRLVFFSVALATMGTLACSGGGGKKVDPVSDKATRLTYTDPSGDGFRLLRGAASTNSKLILELWGPATSATGRGVTFGLYADASKARFTNVAAGESELAQNGSVFDLGGEPRLFKSVMDGDTLRVSMAQKGAGNAKSLNGVLARVAIQLQPGVSKGASVTLDPTMDATVSPATGGTPASITIYAGRLVAE